MSSIASEPIPGPRSEASRIRRVPARGSYDHTTVHRILDAALVSHVGLVAAGILRKTGAHFSGKCSKFGQESAITGALAVAGGAITSRHCVTAWASVTPATCS